MAEEAVEHDDSREDSTGNVGSLGEKMCIAPDHDHQDRQSDQAKDNTGAVHGDAAQPFAQVISFCLEDEPFVAQVRDRDVQQAGEKRGPHVTVRHDGIQNRRQQGESAVAEQRIPESDQQIAAELAGGDVAGQLSAPLVGGF